MLIQKTTPLKASKAEVSGLISKFLLSISFHQKNYFNYIYDMHCLATSYSLSICTYSWVRILEEPWKVLTAVWLHNGLQYAECHTFLSWLTNSLRTSHNDWLNSNVKFYFLTLGIHMFIFLSFQRFNIFFKGQHLLIRHFNWVTICKLLWELVLLTLHSQHILRSPATLFALKSTQGHPHRSENYYT